MKLLSCVFLASPSQCSMWTIVECFAQASVLMPFFLQKATPWGSSSRDNPPDLLAATTQVSFFAPLKSRGPPYVWMSWICRDASLCLALIFYIVWFGWLLGFLLPTTQLPAAAQRSPFRACHCILHQLVSLDAAVLGRMNKWHLVGSWLVMLQTEYVAARTQFPI